MSGKGLKDEIRKAGANTKKTRGNGNGSSKEPMAKTNTPEPPAAHTEPSAPIAEKTMVPPPEPPAPVNPEPPAPPAEKFSPFKGAVDQKAYQAQPIDHSLAAAPEFEFQIQTPQFDTPNPATPPPPAGGGNNAPPPNSGNTGPQPAQPSGPAPVPGATQLTPQEQQQGAELLVDMVLSGYKSLHKMAAMMVEVSDEDLFEMHVEKKLDMNMRIPINDQATEFVSLREFFAEFNKQTKEALVVSDDFIQAVRGPMIRCCIKYGWYMKDEYYILFKFGEDLGIKTMMVINFKKTINKTLKTFMWVYEQQMAKQNGDQPAPPPGVEPPPPAPEGPPVE